MEKLLTVSDIMANINDIIRRAPVITGVTTVREPNGLPQDDRKTPDGIS